MKWIKCSQQMPELNKTVLAYIDGLIISSHIEDENEEKRTRAIKHKDKYPPKLVWYYTHTCCYYITEPATHWMPLPAPPKENEVLKCIFCARDIDRFIDGMALCKNHDIIRNNNS